MHDNANIAFQLQETKAMYESILGLQPRVSGANAGSFPH
jgi:hypothetical protein